MLYITTSKNVRNDNLKKWVCRLERFWSSLSGHAFGRRASCMSFSNSSMSFSWNGDGVSIFPSEGYVGEMLISSL